MSRVTILIADDHTIVRQGLRALLTAEPGLEVIGEASGGHDAVRLARELGPEVVIMDIALPELNGIEATRQIVALSQVPRVIMLSMYTDLEHVVHSLQAGASGYVRKEDADTELVAAVLTGRPASPFLSPSLNRTVVEEHLRKAEASRDEGGKYEPLTTREREVLQLVAEGRLNKQIAVVLGIAERTVEAHRANIMKKLNLRDRAGLVRYAVRKGIVSAEQ